MEASTIGIIFFVVFIIVVVVVFITLFSPSNSLTSLWKRFSFTVPPTATLPPVQSSEVVPVVASNPTTMRRAEVTQPSSVPIFSFDREMKQEGDTQVMEEEGEVVSESATDSRYTLSSTYPGLSGGELTITTPTRKTVRLCERGGFLRMHGKSGVWHWVPSILLDGQEIKYDKSGRFKIGNVYTKAVIIRYKGEAHPLDIRRVVQST